jgi:hypothetical protein
LWIENSNFGKNADYLIPIYPRVASASRPPVLERARDFFIGGTISRVIFLIDGFNVYHSLKENPEHHKYLWFDYRTLAERFTRREDPIPKLIYFSAFATWIPYSMKRHRLLIDALKHPFSPFLPIMPFGRGISTRHMPLATFYFPLTLCASGLSAFHSKRPSARRNARLARNLLLNRDTVSR